MPRQELHTMQGMSYRRSPAETLSGCRHLRCKAFLLIVLGVLLVASFPATYASALLIVGVFLILLGVSLTFMYYVARDLGKDNTATTGQGVNRSWNRIRRQRLQRRRRRNSSSRSSRRSVNTNPTSDNDGTPPPAYETSVSVEELMRCPELSDWTFLPSEPPPEYFPPITALDSNHSSTTATDDQPGIDQSELPIYSISREMSYTLPTYEQALDETNTTTRDAMNENNDIHLTNQNCVVVEVDDYQVNEPRDIELHSTSLVHEMSASHSNNIHLQQLPITTEESGRESADTITQVLI